MVDLTTPIVVSFNASFDLKETSQFLPVPIVHEEKLKTKGGKPVLPPAPPVSGAGAKRAVKTEDDDEEEDEEDSDDEEAEVGGHVDGGEEA